MKNKNTEKIEFLKIVYFDEAAAQDYVDVTNGGRLDWSTQENKEKIAKISNFFHKDSTFWLQIRENIEVSLFL